MVRTPDGVDHPNMEAARAHMFALNYETLGNASGQDFKDAVERPDPANEHQTKLRNAFRDVYLVMWPRAPKSKAARGSATTEAGESGEQTSPPPETQPETQPEPVTEPEPEPEPATHSHKRKGR